MKNDSTGATAECVEPCGGCVERVVCPGRVWSDWSLLASVYCAPVACVVCIQRGIETDTDRKQRVRGPLSPTVPHTCHYRATFMSCVRIARTGTVLKATALAPLARSTVVKNVDLRTGLFPTVGLVSLGTPHPDVSAQSMGISVSLPVVPSIDRGWFGTIVSYSTDSKCDSRVSSNCIQSVQRLTNYKQRYPVASLSAVRVCNR